MDLEAEIRDLRASLEETKFGMMQLIVFLADVAQHTTPTFRQWLANNAQSLWGSVANRQRAEAREIVLSFCRRVVDPAFPLSSELPDDLK